MTVFFLTKFKFANKCPQCPNEKLSGKSLCAKHLRRAKLEFRSWSCTRRALGKCAYCDRKSFHGWLRCRAHTLYNRLKCKLWGEAHKEHIAKYVVERRNAWRSRGLCHKCSEHRPLAVGLKSCRTCVDRHTEQRATS